MKIHVSDLEGVALDYAVAMAEGLRVEYIEEAGEYGIRDDDDLIAYEHIPLYSSSWTQGGPLIVRYGALISPPRSSVHINGGPNSGWRESGSWGSTIFGSERKYRRRAFNHPNEPLVAAMRAIVQFELGDEIEIPDELVVRKA